MREPVPDAPDFAPGDATSLKTEIAAAPPGPDLPGLLARYEPLEGTPVVMADGRAWIIAPLGLAHSDPLFETGPDGRLEVATDAVEPEHRELARMVDEFLSGAPPAEDAEAWPDYMARTVELRLAVQFLALRLNYDLDCDTVNREQIVKPHTFNAVFTALLGLPKKAVGAGSTSPSAAAESTRRP